MAKQASQMDEHQIRLTLYLDSLGEEEYDNSLCYRIPSVIFMVPIDVGYTAWLVGLQNVKHDCNLIISPSDIFQSRLGKKIGNVDLGMYTRGIKGRHKKWSGSLAKEETLPWTCWCNKLHSTICAVLLSEFVSRDVWLQQYLFAFLYSSWSSHGKYTGVVCHSLLQWIIFCQNSPL